MTKLSIKKESIEIRDCPIADADLDVDGAWVAITPHYKFETLDIGPLSIPIPGFLNPGRMDIDQFISLSGRESPLPSRCRAWIARLIDKDTAIIVNAIPSRDVDVNAFIFKSSGKLEAQFFAGYGIQDVLVSKDYFVFGYFDEGVFSGQEFPMNGVAVFDSQGAFVTGYQELFGTKAVDVSDCYAMYWLTDSKFCFFPYMDFPLVHFDLATMTQEVFETPEILRGSNAITCCDNRYYFHSPYDDQIGIYRWEIGDMNVRRIGEFDGELRGLSRGRFISVKPEEVRTITVEE